MFIKRGSLLDDEDQRNLQKLVDALRTQQVIGVCGAGASVCLGYPTWKQLLDLLVSRLEQQSSRAKPHVRALIEDRYDATGLAAWIRKQLEPQIYEDFLKDIFASRGPREVSFEYQDLANLPVRLWMTTNYDNCLRDALFTRLQTQIRVADQIPVGQISSGHDTLPELVYLHGHVSKPSSMVLSISDYHQRYLRENTLSASLHAIAAFPLLFFGYSIEDRHINTCLEEIHVRLGLVDQQRFAILPRTHEQTTESVSLYRSILTQNYGVLPIFYTIEKGSHSGRHALVRELLEAMKVQPVDVSQSGYIQKCYWRSNDVTVGRLREELHKLISIFEADGGLPILRELSWSSRMVELSDLREKDISSLRQVLRTSDFWTETIASQPSGADGFIAGLITAQTPYLPENLNNNIIPDSANAPSIATFQDVNDVVQLDSQGALADECVEYRALLPRLFPPTVPFGLADLFSSHVRWTFHSPVVVVHVYRDQDKSIHAITIAGVGPRDVQEQIQVAAFSLLTVLPDEGQNVVTRGFIHLCVVQHQHKPIQLFSLRGIAARLLGGGSKRKTFHNLGATSASGALADLATLCKQLESDKGFVKVIECSASDLTSYQGYLVQCHLGAGKRKKPLVIRQRELPGAIIRQPFTVMGGSVLEPLTVRIPCHLVLTPAFERVMSAYYDSVVGRMLADIERRIEFWTQELEGDMAQYQWFQQLPKAERSALPDVTLNRMALPEFALDVAVKKPERQSAEVYHLQHLPRRIELDRENLQEQTAKREPLKELRTNRQSAVWRQCFSRVFDAAIRDVPISFDQDLSELFAVWSEQVKGVLRFALLRELEKKGVAEVDIFRTTTFFEARRDDKSEVVAIVPNAVIDSSRAVVAIDKQRRVMSVWDPADISVIESINPETNTAKALDVILERDITSEQKLVELRNLCYESPQVATQLIRRVLSQYRTDDSFSGIRDSVRNTLLAASVGARGLRLIEADCLNSAIELGSELLQGAEQFPSALLYRCFTRLVLDGKDPVEHLKKLRSDEWVEVPRDVRTQFRMALECNPKLVDEFLQTLQLSAEDPKFEGIEIAAAHAECLVEASRLCAQFRIAADSLDPMGETQASAFCKAEYAFELAHSTVQVSPPLSVLRIQKILTGEPL